MEQTRFDRRGVLSFLSITFAVTYAIEGALILGGFRITRLPAMYGQLVVAAVMWVPALAALVTMRFVTRERFAVANVRFGSWKPYVASGLIVPLCFVVNYGLTWLLGIAHPHWDTSEFFAALRPGGGAALPAMPPAGLMLPALFLATLVLAPFVNALFGFGEELGWRGYLLPKLMVLGKWKAYVLLGIVWSLWHLPLIL
ncbi:MAG TPA: CPBP family intramembrane glutamic endopeptidase, partial [Candidatus Bathyarchaeia archaeon]|nr:CPBP family intramembrane glutamic endopeptidase [Candidatus Bathyarchaeia archaeon]